MNSNIWICDEKLRDVFNKEMACVVINGPSNFARAALMAAYGECEDWLEELIAYIRGNDAYVKQHLGEAFPRMNWSPLELSLIHICAAARRGSPTASAKEKGAERYPFDASVPKKATRITSSITQAPMHTLKAASEHSGPP